MAEAVSPKADADFTAIFGELSAVKPELRTITDEPRKYYRVTKVESCKGGPMFFGAVMRLKGYLSDHRMPLYACPEGAKTVFPERKKRMPGKSCMNLRARDAERFVESWGP